MELLNRRTLLKTAAASANAEDFRARLLVGTDDLGFAFDIDRGVAAAFPA